MAFVEQNTRSKLPSITAVVLIHVGIGYAFISGLAYNVIHEGIPVFNVSSISETPPPPPVAPPPPPQAQPRQRIDMPTQIVSLPQVPDVTIVTVPSLTPVTPPSTIAMPQPPVATVTPPPAALASGVRPRGDKGTWITTDDYPSAALRNSEEGVVAISVGIDARGRVASCQVTQSSGHARLDEATCRIYARRARFAPALDNAGTPVAASFADRIRWQIPQ